MKRPRTIPAIESGEVWLILGEQGAGKSYLAQSLAWRWRREGGAVIVCDPVACLGALAGVAGFVAVPELAAADWWPPETGRRLLLVIDEAHRVARRGRTAPPWLGPLCAQVRHLNMSVVATSQHPAQIHGDLRTLATHIYASTVRGAEHLAWARAGGLHYPKTPPPKRQFVRLR